MPVRDATPEELIRSTKDVTLATAKAVAAGNSCQQDDIITAANMGRKAVTEMLIICKVSQNYNAMKFFWIVTWLKTTFMDKSLGTLVFLARFPIHTGPSPPLTPQTMLDAYIYNFFRVSTLYRVGRGRTARNFRKGCTVLRGNREMTEKYEYCSSTVPRTFVQDCSVHK